MAKANTNAVPHPILTVLKGEGITNKALAQACAISPALVSLVNRGVVRATPNYRRRVTAYLGVPEDMLFRAEDNTP